MTPYSQPPSLVPPEALPSSGFSFWGLKGQGGSGTGTSPASPRLGPGPETPGPPRVPSSGVRPGSCLPSMWCLSFTMLRIHPAPHSPFPGRGSACPAQTPLTPQPRLCPQKASSMVPLCQGPPLPPGPHPRGPAQTTDISPCPPHLCIPHLLSTRTLGSPDLGPASFLWATSPCLNGRQLPSGTQCGPQASSWGD